jgi:hypothetical protein
VAANAFDLQNKYVYTEDYSVGSFIVAVRINLAATEAELNLYLPLTKH